MLLSKTLKHYFIDAEWLDWSQWSSCNNTCGKGIVERIRDPSNALCLPLRGDDHDTRKCNTCKFCIHTLIFFSYLVNYNVHSYQDGKWESWNPWSRCHIDCQMDTRVTIRTRECNHICCAQPGDDQRSTEKGIL